MHSDTIKNNIAIFMLTLTVLSTALFAVSTRITTHQTAEQFLKGETENIIIDSEGVFHLARKSDVTDLEKYTNIWTVNTVIPGPKDSFHLGTSPNGMILHYKDGELRPVYPDYAKLETEETKDSNTGVKTPPTNEHVFAMTALDDGAILAAVSGPNPRLVKINENGSEVTRTFEDIHYIFAMIRNDDGSLLLAAGPEGRILKMADPSARPQTVFKSKDNNFLSMAMGSENFLYAGTDQRGLIYKINLDTSQASVVFDAPQEEITALVLAPNGALYAAATSAGTAKNLEQPKSISMAKMPGQTPTPMNADLDKSEESSSESTETIDMNQMPNGPAMPKPGQRPQGPDRGIEPDSDSHIYRIDPTGYVTDVFKESAVFFAMAVEDERLLLATGNSARLFSIDPATRQQRLAHEDSKASQLTALAVTADLTAVAASNPPRLIVLQRNFAPEGTYISEMIDAAQPARWGTFKIRAQQPPSTQVMVATRSGNVEDPNDSAFSPWTEPTPITDSIEMLCPVGRFCQYKVTLKTENPDLSPQIKQIDVSSLVPNLPPRVNSLSATPMSDNPQKKGVFNVQFQAEDGNSDTLNYTIEIRRENTKPWILLKEDLEEANYEWDSKTVPDGRYRLRVTADDKKSNSQTTWMSGSRVSEPVIVDNTPPAIVKHSITMEGQKAIVSLHVTDEMTPISSLEFTVNSSSEWVSTLPEDMLFDTKNEMITFITDELEAGAHIVTVRISDSGGNIRYESWQVIVEK